MMRLLGSTITPPRITPGDAPAEPIPFRFTLQRCVRLLPPFLRRQKVAWALGRLFPRGTLHGIDFNASRLVVDLSDAAIVTTLLNCSFGDYGYFDLARELLRPDSTHFDVGANYGFHTFGLLGSGQLKQVRYYLFEPNPTCAKCQRASRQLHPGVFLEVVEAAVSEQAGQMALRFDPRVTGEGALHSPSAEDGGLQSVPVDVIRLDEFIAAGGIGKVRLMKVDIEGSELRAFQGAREALAAGLVEFIYFEVNPPALREQGTTPEAAFAFLQEAGFALYWPHDDLTWIEASYGQPASHRFQHAYRFLPAPGKRRVAVFERAEYTGEGQMDLLAIHESVPIHG